MERQVHSTEKKWGVWEQLLCKWSVFIHGGGQGVENRDEPAWHPALLTRNRVIDGAHDRPRFPPMFGVVFLHPCALKPEAMSIPSSPEVKKGTHTRYVLRLEDLEDAVLGREISHLCKGVAPHW